MAGCVLTAQLPFSKPFLERVGCAFLRYQTLSSEHTLSLERRNGGRIVQAHVGSDSVQILGDYGNKLGRQPLP